MLRGYCGTALLVGDDTTEPIVDGAVVLDDDGVVVAVGQVGALRKAHPQVQFEQHHAVLTPGLVNAHTHLELSALRGKVAGGRGFAAWLSELFAQRGPLAPELDFEAIDEGVGGLLRSGTVAVGEVTNSLSALSSLGSAPLFARVFHEVYGVQKDAADAALKNAQDARAALSSLPPNVSYSLSPHTPYSMHPDLLRTVVDAGQEAGLRQSIHLAEHAAERAFMMDGTGPLADLLARVGRGAGWSPPGKSSVHFMATAGLLHPHMILVHLTDARLDELEVVAQAGCPVVLCPRSNLHIEVRLPPLIELLHLGIKPGLGTDSLASCPSLDVLEEAKALHFRFPSVAPRTLLAMTMAYGAEALGLGDQVGRLAVGLRPGLLAFPHGGSPPADPERFVLQMNKTAPREVLNRPRCTMETLP